MSFSPRIAWAMVEAHLAVLGVSLLVMFGATVNAQRLPTTNPQPAETTAHPRVPATHAARSHPTGTATVEPSDRLIGWRRVKGRVVDSGGTGLASAVIRCVIDMERYDETSHGPSAWAATDVHVQLDGKFALDVPGTTPLVVVVEAPGFAPAFVAVSQKGDFECEIPMDPPTRIVGTVTDFLSRRPVAGASIHARDPWKRGVVRHTTTDASGRYELADTQAGRWEFTVTSDGYAKHAERMDVRGDKAPVDFTLTAGRQLEVTVSRRGLGTLIKGATVQCDDRTLKTDENGVVRFNHVDDKANFVHVSAEGFGPVRYAQFSNATVARTIKMALELSPHVVVTGRVVDDQSRPVEGALVSFSRYDELHNSLEERTRYLFHAVSPTGSDGRFTIMAARREDQSWDEPQGYLRAVHATLGIAKLPCKESDVAEGYMSAPRDELRIVFSTQSRSVHGTVYDKNRDPVKGVLVEAVKVIGDSTIQSSDRPWCITDESGGYQISGLRSGPIILNARGEGIVGQRAEAPSDVTSKSFEVNFSVERIRTITGRVVSPEGTPVVSLEISRETGSQGSALLDSTVLDEGRFVGRFTDSDVYSIMVSATGYMHQVATYSGMGDEWVIRLIRDPKFVLVRGMVVEARSQAPLRNANVTFDLVDCDADPDAKPDRVRWSQFKATTQFDGTFELAVERGKYAVGASHSDSGMSALRLIEVDSATAPPRIEIVPACHVKFQFDGFDEKWRGPPVMVALLKEGDPSATRLTAKPDVHGHVHFRLEADATYTGIVIRACGNPPIEIDDEMNWAVGRFLSEEVAPFRTESGATLTRHVRLLEFGCVDVKVDVRDVRSAALPQHYKFHCRAQFTRLGDPSDNVRNLNSRGTWPRDPNPLERCHAGFAPTTDRQLYLPFGRYRVEAQVLGIPRQLEIEVKAGSPATVKLDFVVPDDKLPEGYLPQAKERK